MFEKLTIQQRVFCSEFLVDMRIGDAAERAGFSVSSGTRLMKRQDVRAFIAHLMQRRAARMVVNQNNVLEELSSVAFSSIRNLFDDDGRMLNIADLDADTAHAVEFFRVGSDETDDGGRTRTVEVRFHNKMKALELAGKHLGMFEERHRVMVDTDYLGMTDQDLVKQALRVLPALAPQDEELDFL